MIASLAWSWGNTSLIDGPFAGDSHTIFLVSILWNTFTGSLLTLVSNYAVTKDDIQNHFKEGPGTISEIKLMSGFGFIEYTDKADARDVVPGT